MNAHQELARYLRACRKAVSLRLEEVGEALGVHPSQVSRWENGKQLPKQTRAPALAWLYKVDLGEMREKIGAAYEEEVDELSLEVVAATRALSAVEGLTARLDEMQAVWAEVLRRLPDE